MIKTQPKEQERMWQTKKPSKQQTSWNIYISSNNGIHLLLRPSLHFITLQPTKIHTTSLNLTLYFLSFKPHPTTLHSTSLHFNQLHLIPLQYKWWHFTSCHLNFTQLHFTPLHYPCRHFTYSHLNLTHPHFATLSFGLNQFKFPTAPLWKRYITYFSPFSCLSYYQQIICIYQVILESAVSMSSQVG
jgi:hypothetical protein